MVKSKVIRKFKKRRKGKEKWKIYIHKVLKQVHPELSISNRAMSVMNDLIQHLFEQCCDETRQIVRLGNKKTATTREIQTAIRLWVPGELAKHAQSEAVRIIMTFSSPHTVFKNLKAVYKNDSDDELWSRVFGSRENWIIYRERPKNFL